MNILKRTYLVDSFVVAADKSVRAKVQCLVWLFGKCIKKTILDVRSANAWRKHAVWTASSDTDFMQSHPIAKMLSNTVKEMKYYKTTSYQTLIMKRLLISVQKDWHSAKHNILTQ